LILSDRLANKRLQFIADRKRESASLWAWE